MSCKLKYKIATHGRTLPLRIVSGAVENLEVVALSDKMLGVSWGPPSSPNGAIANYELIVTNLINFTEKIYNISKDANNTTICDGISELIH